MDFDFWGFEGKFLLHFPNQPFGYILLCFYLLCILVFLFDFQKHKRNPNHFSKKTTRNILLILVLITPIANALFHIQIPLISSQYQANLSDSFYLIIAILGAVPWMLAGGLLGGRYAILIGFIGGFFRAAWVTNDIYTLFHTTLQAGFILWLIERNYDDRFGNALRQPIISAIFGGLFLSVFTCLEILTYGEWDLYDGLGFLLPNVKSVIIAEVIELAVAGLVAEILRFSFPKLWHRPRWLAPGPYNRSLTGKILSVFLLLGIFTSAILLTGTWFLMRKSARESIESQMIQTAEEAGSGIPYFIQTGRSLTQRLAEEIEPVFQETDQLQAQLDQGLTLVPFFNGLVLYDQSGTEITHTLTEEWDEDAFFLLSEDAITDALHGIPGERILPPKKDSLAARFIFFSPIDSDEAEIPVGVLAGWTNLEINPFLLPTIHRLEEIDPGSAFIVDDDKKIIVHPDPQMVMKTADIDLLQHGHFSSSISSEGLQQLVYIYAVEGYSWYVVIVKPMNVVERLALSLGFQLFSMLAILGLVIFVVIFIVSKRLSRPLELIAGAAESIARGNLNRTTPKSGEGEIGVLADSFERMRASLRDRLNEMDLLLAASQRIASSLNFQDFIPPILSGMRELTNADIVRLVFTLDPNHEGELEIYQAGVDSGNWASLDKQIMLLCKERGSFILENPSRAQAVLNINRLKEPIEALMALPIHKEDQFVGTIWFGHRQPRGFSENDKNIGSIIAGQLGIAISNAHLFQQAEAERQRLKAVIEATPDAVIVTDQNGLISLANPAAEIVLKVHPDKACGMHTRDVVHIPKILELLITVLSESKTSEIELEDGRIFFVSVTPIESDGRRATGKVCVLWDITHYKNLDSLKSQFVATVSHELRTPLALMRGYVKMFSMVGTTNNQQREYIQKMMQSADRMAHLVDNLLDLQRIEAGRGLKLEETEVKEIITEVLATYKPQAVTKQITLSADHLEELPKAYVDPTLIRQALTNLMENAIQFTPSGGRVTISAAEAKGSLIISVQDTGVGISPADQALLFEKFSRFRNEGEKSEVGSGLGLAIVKSITEHHGGQVYVESQLGKGSTFSIKIPLRILRSKKSLDNEDK